MTTPSEILSVLTGTQLTDAEKDVVLDALTLFDPVEYDWDQVDILRLEAVKERLGLI